MAMDWIKTGVEFTIGKIEVVLEKQHYGFGCVSIRGYNGYNDSAEIEVFEGTCHLCAEEKNVLEMDGSMGEYSNGVICLDCIQSLFREKEEQ